MSFEIGGQEDEAASILNLLDRVYGLTGPRLAVSLGDERCLTDQILEALELHAEPWHYEFIKGQVRAAAQLQKLEGRVQGNATSPKWWWYPKRAGRIVTEEEAESKVLNALVEELKIAGAPVLKELEGVSNPDRVVKALLGKHRVSTVRRYLASWQHFRRWVWPMAKIDSVSFVDYLCAREEQGLGPSLPLAVAEAVTWFERLADFEERSQWLLWSWGALQEIGDESTSCQEGA